MKRHEAFLNKLNEEKKAIVMLELSDDDDDDTTETYKPPKQRTSPKKKAPEKQEDSQKDDEDEDPEFRELAAKAREKARKEEEAKKSRSRNEGRDDGVSGSSTPIDTGPNPVINILVFSNIDGTEPLVVKRKWNQDFRLILDAWLGRQQALPEHVKKNIYFTWRCKKIFPVATCRSLGIKLDQYGNAMIPNDQGDMRISDDQIVLVATTDAQLKKEKDAEEAERKRKEKVEEEPEAAPEEATVKKLRLYLRCPDYKEVRLAVLPVRSLLVLP